MLFNSTHDKYLSLYYIDIALALLAIFVFIFTVYIVSSAIRSSLRNERELDEYLNESFEFRTRKDWRVYR